MTTSTTANRLRESLTDMSNRLAEVIRVLRGGPISRTVELKLYARRSGVGRSRVLAGDLPRRRLQRLRPAKGQCCPDLQSQGPRPGRGATGKVT